MKPQISLTSRAWYKHNRVNLIFSLGFSLRSCSIFYLVVFSNNLFVCTACLFAVEIISIDTKKRKMPGVQFLPAGRAIQGGVGTLRSTVENLGVGGVIVMSALCTNSQSIADNFSNVPSMTTWFTTVNSNGGGNDERGFLLRNSKPAPGFECEIAGLILYE